MDYLTLEPFPAEHPASELVLILLAGGEKSRPIVSGTAVFIAPGLALTASHVFDDYTEQLEPNDVHSSQSSYAVQAFSWCQAIEDYVRWRVFRHYSISEIDIGLIQAVPDAALPDGFSVPLPLVNVTPPLVGTEVQVVGAARPKVSPDGSGGWIVRAPVLSSQGTVTQVFPIKRDRAKIPFPCFEMNVAVEGSMSGGPVFSREGALVGITASSFDFLSPGREVAYASLIWPAVALPFAQTQNLGFDPSEEPADKRVLHLMREGRINAQGFEGIKLPPEVLRDDLSFGFHGPEVL